MVSYEDFTPHWVRSGGVTNSPVFDQKASNNNISYLSQMIRSLIISILNLKNILILYYIIFKILKIIILPVYNLNVLYTNSFKTFYNLI